MTTRTRVEKMRRRIAAEKKAVRADADSASTEELEAAEEVLSRLQTNRGGRRMKSKQQRRMVMIDDPLWERLEAVGEKTKLSRSAVVRIGVRAVLELAEGEQPNLVRLVEAEKNSGR